MKIEGVQKSYNPTVMRNNFVSVPYIVPKGLENDIFVRNNNVQFTGANLFEKAIIKFMKNKSYNVSIKASRRFYLDADRDLEKIVKQVKIPVTKKESINGWDINPNNSNKYLIFLHGFSQNITNNQPLYKALKDTDYGVLAIDYRGYGKNKSSWHIDENDIVQDVAASVKYLKDKGVGGSIGLIGHSFGSYVAAKASKVQDFAFQILVSPILSLEFWLKNVVKHPKKYKDEMLMIKYIPGFKDKYSKVFDIQKCLSDNHTETYIVQSQKDNYVLTSKVITLTDSIPNLKNYKILPKGGHRMDDAKIFAVKDIVDSIRC